MCPEIPLGGKCGLSEAVMDLASLTLGQIAQSGLMLSGGHVTVHLREEWEWEVKTNRQIYIEIDSAMRLTAGVHGEVETDTKAAQTK